MGSCCSKAFVKESKKPLLANGNKKNDESRQSTAPEVPNDGPEQPPQSDDCTCAVPGDLPTPTPEKPVELAKGHGRQAITAIVVAPNSFNTSHLCALEEAKSFVLAFISKADIVVVTEIAEKDSFLNLKRAATEMGYEATASFNDIIGHKHTLLIWSRSRFSDGEVFFYDIDLPWEGENKKRYQVVGVRLHDNLHGGKSVVCFPMHIGRNREMMPAQFSAMMGSVAARIVENEDVLILGDLNLHYLGPGDSLRRLRPQDFGYCTAMEIGGKQKDIEALGMYVGVEGVKKVRSETFGVNDRSVRLACPQKGDPKHDGGPRQKSDHPFQVRFTLFFDHDEEDENKKQRENGAMELVPKQNCEVVESFLLEVEKSQGGFEQVLPRPPRGPCAFHHVLPIPEARSPRMSEQPQFDKKDEQSEVVAQQPPEEKKRKEEEEKLHEDETYVKLKTSHAYHCPHCRYVRNKDNLEYLTWPDILARPDLRPCKVCNPRKRA